MGSLPAMKRALLLLAGIVCVAMCFSLAACGGGDDTTSTTIDTTDVTTDLGDTVEVDPADIAPYPDDVRKEFLDNCLAASGLSSESEKKSFCQCTLEATENTLPVKLYEEINSPKPGETFKVAPPETAAAIQDCFAQVE